MEIKSFTLEKISVVWSDKIKKPYIHVNIWGYGGIVYNRYMFEVNAVEPYEGKLYVRFLEEFISTVIQERRDKYTHEQK